MKTFNTTHLLAVICAILFASCSTDQDVFTAPDYSTERIDMVIEGDDKEYIYLKSTEENSSLIDYVTYGTHSHQIDILINIDAHRTLILKLVDVVQFNPWEQQVGFSMYANRDLEDKQRYMIAELIDGSEIASHRSHANDAFPQSTSLNVLNIIDFNPANNEMSARIIDLEMMSANGSETIMINGTFRGVVDFQN